MKDKVLNYIKDVLEVPRDEYNGMPTCPFAKQERENDNIYLDEIFSSRYKFDIIDRIKREEINYVCSLGFSLATASLLKRNNLKKCSYPFDWIFSWHQTNNYGKSHIIWKKYFFT